MTVLAFNVRGQPKPQGSKRVVVNKYPSGKTHAKALDDNEAVLLPWREAVKQAAVEAMGSDLQRGHFGYPISGPVGLYLVLVQPRPRAHFLKGGGLSAAGRDMPFPVGRDPGDIDKLLRAVMDALADAGVYRNDKLVCHLDGLDKVWSDHPGAGGWPGARIVVRSLALDQRRPLRNAGGEFRFLEDTGRTTDSLLPPYPYGGL